jgi:hypothetical protein
MPNRSGASGLRPTTVPTPLVAAESGSDASRRWAWAAVAILGATMAQLAVAATFAGSLSQFHGKGFGVRLAAYPVLMLLAPAIWAVDRRRRGTAAPLPWAGFALIMVPFLIDVTGNSANLYDTLWWWDDANHLVNWMFLCGGIGVLLLQARIRPTWAVGSWWQV